LCERSSLLRSLLVLRCL
nr:immunoglobulin heavy chain junction region [Mus musculus]MBK4186941.1 immunoglobulin heavy chain junction region [Mus musculus]MBK4186944.1 immunoglobulin heavy chain junction region [Mus musculus]MBK4186950.1 immunoglobulin heavy chain junction region [Mus musculus]MBK4186968.1 immunoglobulin heavy chain junction region [Mus musculus]